MILNLLISMIQVFYVEFGKYPKKIILSFQLEKDLIKELRIYSSYGKEFCTKGRFRGIDVEYRLDEDFISLEK